MFNSMSTFFSSAISACLMAGLSACGSTTPGASLVAPISETMPYDYKSVRVLGSKMAYVESGDGDPILFIHGNPTSSYLWRNIMPYAEPYGRVIAIDLIGMGRSDQPGLNYDFSDHAAYLEAFIEELELTNITLVVHDWGSALGMNYARQNEDRVKSIAFMEAIVPPALPASDYAEMGRVGGMFRQLHTPGRGEQMILEKNYFVETVLGKRGVMRRLSANEMEEYRQPYPTRTSRKPTLMWPRQMPIGANALSIGEIVRANGDWLYEADIPKLYFYASPGALNPPETVQHLQQNVTNLETRFVGAGRHFIQEDRPHEIGLGLADWMRRHHSAKQTAID